MKEMNGYTEADKIDKKINILIKDYPIEENLEEWAKLTRTIKTTMILIENVIKEERKQNG